MKHNFEISYTQQGDYLLPDLRLPEQPKVEIGIWGKRHLRYIKQHHKVRSHNRYRGLKQGSPPPVMAVWESWLSLHEHLIFRLQQSRFLPHS